MYIELEKANKEIKKVVDYITENEEMFDHMNLKMYDAYFYIEDAVKEFLELANEIPDLFYEWCKMEYTSAQDYLLDEHGIVFRDLIRPLGRTSSFYLVDDNFIPNDMLATIQNLLFDYCSFNFTDAYYDEDGNIKLKPYGDYDFADADCTNEVEYIADGFYEWFMYYIEDVKTVYDYIENFKKCQVDSFRYFLESIVL